MFLQMATLCTTFLTMSKKEILSCVLPSWHVCGFFLFRFGPVKYTFLAEVLVPSLYCHCVKIVIKSYQTRFCSFNQEVFKSMCWLNQAKWNLSFLADHYKDILKEVGFDNAYLKSEWKLFKHMDMLINIRHNCAFQKNSKNVFLSLTSVYLNLRHWNFSHRREPWLHKYLLQHHLRIFIQGRVETTVFTL